jgi:basic amino acid/polyamine antiporter, APA family
MRGDLGVGGAVALGVGGTIGGGIFVLIGVAAEAAGPGALLAFVLGLAVVALIALPYTELTARAPRAGGGYAFTQTVLGGRWGFVMGWGYAGAWLLGSGYVTTGFGSYAESLSGLPRVPVALALVAACTVLNVYGLRPSARAQSLVLAAALVGLAAFVVWGLPHVETSRLSPLLPHGAEGVLSATVLAFLALNGFDAIAAASEEMSDPAHTVPRAILRTLLIVGGLYTAVALVALGTMPLNALAGSQAPLADAAAGFGGAGARTLVLVTAVVTIAATANAMVVVSSRVLFGMARDGHLPARLGQLGSARGTPVASVLISGGLIGLVALVAFTQGVAELAGAAGLLYVLHYLPPLIGLTLVRRRESTPPTGVFTTPAAGLILPAAIGCCAVVALASGREAIAIGSGWMLLGGLYRLGVARRSDRLRRHRLSDPPSHAEGGPDAARGAGVWDLPCRRAMDCASCAGIYGADHQPRTQPLTGRTLDRDAGSDTRHSRNAVDD